ncbi:DUF192 domain-containing protein [Xenophilus sp. Marseille-Q4582]|uniref:DUF192 domain-containing protein n=1 Tax=Xenophilus sp. Marseille-Q4582 TaxID=2866600 RepID=UPI001CE3BC7A|nr:DUF192 domain-containing protein [Xenophilus sp. Marseille-Q4582]
MGAASAPDPLSHLPALAAWRAGRCLDLRVRLAASFGSRLRGLLGVPLPPDLALLIRPCASVHMWGMRQPLDVLFLGREGTVLQTCTLRPWQLRGAARAHAVLECAAGTLARLDLRAGQRLQFQAVAPPLPRTPELQP